MKHIFVVGIAGIAMLACHERNEYPATPVSKLAINYAPPPVEAFTVEWEDDQATQGVDRKLIKIAEINYKTDSLSMSRNKIIAAATTHNGYVSNDEQSHVPGTNETRIVVRIPAAHFDIFLSESTEGVNQFDKREIEVQDITSEYVDVETRVKTKKELELSYIKLLDKAKSVKDMLEIEEEIGSLRADIESMEGQLKLWHNNVAYSTITFRIYQELPVDSEPNNRFSGAFISGWDGLVSFSIAMIALWPLLIVIITAILILKWLRVGRAKRSDQIPSVN